MEVRLHLILALIKSKQGEARSLSRTMWLFTWREEHPRTRKILKGGRTLRWVYRQKCRSVSGAQIEKVREGIKNGGRQR